MTLVRILVDGPSLLHEWKDLAPGKPRDSEAAREELINRLTTYYDAAGVPVTLVLEAPNPSEPPEEARSLSTIPDLEILFCRQGQSPTQMLEHLAPKVATTGPVLVVTDPATLLAHRPALQGQVQAPSQFLLTVKTALQELEQKILHFNQSEDEKFSQHG